MIEPADHRERERIRTSHDETLFVEAGAGTGKTTSLVARVVHMVATGHLSQIGDLASITFTENAAAELRSRIREGLEAASRGAHLEQPYDAVQRERCLVALGSLEDAVIMTLHGFSARILGEAPVEAGLPPGFAVADAMTTSVSADDAWRGFLDELLEDLAVRPQLLAGLTIDPRILPSLHDIAGAISQSWDRFTGRPLQVCPLPRVDSHALIAPLREALKDRGRWPSGDNLTAWLEGPTTAMVDALGRATDSMDVLELLAQKLGSKGGQATAWAKAGLSKADVVAALAEAESARLRLLHDVGAAVTETLAARVQDWVLLEAGRRRSEGSLDFHDLLVFARDVLRDNPLVRQRLHHTWPVIMVDEFQDTDPLQVEIVHLLAGSVGELAPPAQGAKGWDCVEVEAGRLFFVGDAKQSIFRFRRADIETFRAVGTQYSKGQTALSVNFRSVPGVIDAANTVFGSLIGDDADSGIDYSPLQTYREVRSANDPSGPGSTPPAPVQLLGGPQDADMATIRTTEAQHIADLIVRAKAQGWVVGAKDPRKASYGDVAILLPTRTSLGSLERALQARDVPYRVESRSLVWATDAVGDLVTLLQAIDNPSDEVAVLAALRHAGLACTDAALLEWRASGGRWSFMAEAPASLPVEHPVAAGLSELRRWHEARWWMPVNELVESLVRELRLIELTATTKRPRDHWRRMRFLVDQSRAWCDAGGSGLGGFVDWAARQIENEADVLETVVPESDDDAVRILTVHGSKGLEFPITIVAGLASTSGRPSNLVWDGCGQPQIRLKAGALETQGYFDANKMDDQESKLEATRLLYVALTRAMDYLVLGCYHKPPNQGAKSHAQKVWDLLSASGLAVVDAMSPAGSAGSAPAELMVSPGNAMMPGSAPDRAEFARAREALLTAVGLRVATSPTALVKAAQVLAADDNFPDEAGAATRDEIAAAAGLDARQYPRRGSSKGAAIGTAVHRVLELVDLANPTEPEIIRLAELACTESEIPALVNDVAGRASTALGADVVLQAGHSGRAWREVYVIVRDGERYVEGYIDLLAQAPDGMMVVVDYKTDRVDLAEDLSAKQAHYAPQLSAYQSAIRTIAGANEVRAELVFAAPAPRTGKR
ncbi:MAG: UvrD-helicase domain-containing protein [Actinomycetota bacterium]